MVRFLILYCHSLFDVVAADVAAGSSSSSFPVVIQGLLLYFLVCIIYVVGLHVFYLLMGAILVFFFTVPVVSANVQDSYQSPGPVPSNDCLPISTGFGLRPQMSNVRPMAVIRPECGTLPSARPSAPSTVGRGICNFFYYLLSVLRFRVYQFIQLAHVVVSMLFFIVARYSTVPRRQTRATRAGAREEVPQQGHRGMLISVILVPTVFLYGQRLWY